jgi:hypothetical protein
MNMGCDIHGYIEYRKGGKWNAALEIDLSRSYDLFGCLFGVRNYANFRPIANSRGLPKDISEKVKDEISMRGENRHSYTFLCYNEILQIDWEEEAESLDERIHIFAPDGTYAMKTGGGTFAFSSIDVQRLRNGETVTKENGYSYRCVKMKRKDAITSGWRKVECFMQTLASRYGNENVRLIVWFDN